MAEVREVQDVFIGVNAIDYSGYPDCRPEFIVAFERMANLATKMATSGEKFTIHAPLIYLTKAQIIRRALSWAWIIRSRIPVTIRMKWEGLREMRFVFVEEARV